MSAQRLLTVAFSTAIALPIVWVIFWSALMPQIFNGGTWAGYESLIPHLFFVGLVGGPVASFLVKQ